MKILNKNIKIMNYSSDSDFDDDLEIEFEEEVDDEFFFSFSSVIFSLLISSSFSISIFSLI